MNRGSWLLSLVLLTLTGCGGGAVANTDVSPSAAASANACSEGSDASVQSTGADTFTPPAGVTASPQPGGLQVVDVKAGDGSIVGTGQCVTVHYTGWLADGTKFDSSRDHGQGFRFQVGAGG